MFMLTGISQDQFSLAVGFCKNLKAACTPAICEIIACQMMESQKYVLQKDRLTERSNFSPMVIVTLILFTGGWVHSVSFSASGDKLAWVGHDSSVAVVNGADGLK